MEKLVLFSYNYQAMAKGKEDDQTESLTFDVKDYLKISFELVNNKLTSIDDKTAKTEANLQGVIKIINEMKLVDAGHTFNCPTTTFAHELNEKIDREINIINLRLLKFDFYEKHWRTFAISGTVVIIGMMLTGWFALSNLKETLVKNKQVKTMTYEFSKNQFPDSIGTHISRVTAR